MQESKEKPVLVATGGSVLSPVLELKDKVAVLPLEPRPWQGYQEKIPLISPQAPAETGMLPALAQTCRVFRLPMPPHLEPLRNELILTYFQNAHRLNGLLEIFDRVAEEVKIVGVVVHNDVDPVTRLACAWANARDIPAIHVPHAHYFDVWRDERGWDVHDQVTAPYVAAINDVQASWYRSRGARTVKVCGAPVWDRWADFVTPVEKARKLLGVSLDRTTVTYMCSWPQATSLFGLHNLEVPSFREFLGAMKGLGWQLILLFHHGAAEEICRWHADEARKFEVPGVATREHFQLCLQAADVVMTFGPSNTLIEASVIDKPTIAISPETQIVKTVPPDADAISVALVEARGEGVNKGLKSLAPHIGEATQKVAQFVEEVCLSQK